MNFSILFLLFSYSFFFLANEVQCQEVNQIYENCNENGTVCYGDAENCIEEKTCVYLTIFNEADEDFQIQFWDRCAHTKTHNFLFAVGIATYDIRGEIIDCNQPLEMKNFKFFNFWNPIKCPVERERQFDNTSRFDEYKINKDNWKSMCDIRVKETASLPKEPLHFVLSSYLQRHVFFSIPYGYWKNSKPSYVFAASHKYFTKDGIFYLTNYTDAANLLRNGSSQLYTQNFLRGFFGWIVLIIICLTMI